MKISTMPKEVAAELLAFIAENEDFENVCEELQGEYGVSEIKALLREITKELILELKCEKGDDYDFKKCTYLSKKSKKIISYLSPGEEKALLKAFGLTEEKK